MFNLRITRLIKPRCAGFPGVECSLATVDSIDVNKVGLHANFQAWVIVDYLLLTVAHNRHVFKIGGAVASPERIADRNRSNSIELAHQIENASSGYGCFGIVDSEANMARFTGGTNFGEAKTS
jgi:hypothetical protein